MSNEERMNLIEQKRQELIDQTKKCDGNALYWALKDQLVKPLPSSFSKIKQKVFNLIQDSIDPQNSIVNDYSDIHPTRNAFCGTCEEITEQDDMLFRFQCFQKGNVDTSQIDQIKKENIDYMARFSAK